jgi:serine/threonine-protein kinase
MADALEACDAATPAEVARWVSTVAARPLSARRGAVESLEGLVAIRTLENAVPSRLDAPLQLGLWPLVAAGVLVALLGVGGVLWLRGSSAPAPAPVLVTVPSPPAAVVVPPPAPAVVAPVAHDVPAQPSEPVASPRPAPPPPARAPARPARDCTPPFVIDAQGVKHFKVECL